MTKEELEKALKEVEDQRSLLREELNRWNGRIEVDGNLMVTGSTVAKKVLYNAVTSGNLKNTLDKISDSIDFTKTTVTCFSQIVEKAQAKIDGKIDEITMQSGSRVMSDMWPPMVLSLMQTEEFQHIAANMLVKVIQEA